MSTCEEQRNDHLTVEKKGSENIGSCNEASQSDEDIPNIFRIPPEIRANILERLDIQNLLVIRLTHPLLKSLVDHYLGINAVIHEIPSSSTAHEFEERLKFYGEVALRHVRIGDLHEKRHRLGVNICKNGLRKTSRFNTLILYPQYLQSIQFEGTVSVQFVRKILLHCINLKSFFILIGTNFTGGLIFPKVRNKSPSNEEVQVCKYGIRLPKLHALKLFVVSPRIWGTNENHTENILSVLRLTCSQCLSRLILQVWVTPGYKFSSISWTIAKFLKLHPTLKSVFIGFLYETPPYRMHTEELGDEDKSTLLSLEKELTGVSKCLALQKIGFSSKSVHLKFWVPFIAEQSSLDHISLTFDKKQGSNWEYLCQNSCKTLLQFFVRGEFASPFDCFSLDVCTVLEEFCLHNTNDHILQDILVKNVPYLPSTLTSLILFNTVTPTADIIQLLQKLNKLRTLVLFKTGRGSGHGVDVNCLQKVFQMRSLMSVLIVRFIARTRQDAQTILQMMEIQEAAESSSEVVVADENLQDSDWDDGWNTDTDSTTSSGDSSSSSDEENNNLRGLFDSGESSRNSRALTPRGLPTEEVTTTDTSEEDMERRRYTERLNDDRTQLDRRRSTSNNFRVQRGITSGVYENELELNSNINFHEDSLVSDEEEDEEDEENEEDEEDEEDEENEEELNALQEIIDENPHVQPALHLAGIENIAEMNLNPAGNELQIVFDGDINLEDMDLAGLIQYPDLQIHFVIDTILDIISPELENSHWTRREDVYGNVIFNLKLCMQTDF